MKTKYVYFYNAEVLDYYGNTTKRLAGLYTAEYKIDKSDELDIMKYNIVQDFGNRGDRLVIASLSFLHEVQD